MVKNEELVIEVKKYQQDGIWSEELHVMCDELCHQVEARHNFADDPEDFKQNGYIVLMHAAKCADTNRDLFVYFYTCLVNMGIRSYTRAKQLREIQKKIWESGI